MFLKRSRVHEFRQELAMVVTDMAGGRKRRASGLGDNF